MREQKEENRRRQEERKERDQKRKKKTRKEHAKVCAWWDSENGLDELGVAPEGRPKERITLLIKAED